MRRAERINEKGTGPVKKKWRKKPATRRPNRALSALLAIAETASQGLEPDKIISDTLDRSISVLGFDLGYVRTLDAQTGNVVVRASQGLRQQEHGSPSVPLHESRRP